MKKKMLGVMLGVGMMAVSGVMVFAGTAGKFSGNLENGRPYTANYEVTENGVAGVIDVKGTKACVMELNVNSQYWNKHAGFYEKEEQYYYYGNQSDTESATFEWKNPGYQNVKPGIQFFADKECILSRITNEYVLGYYLEH